TGELDQELKKLTAQQVIDMIRSKPEIMPPEWAQDLARTQSNASIGCAGGLLCFGGFLCFTKSVAALARCLASITCSSDGSSAQKSICDVSCPDSPAKSARAAIIAFGGTSSGVAIVQSGSIGSIFKFQRNAFTNVGCGCTAACSGFCGTKLAQFGVYHPIVNIVWGMARRITSNS
ncbi:MAG: hypothetical protein EZS28_051273, partial [Streblomastix strix]